MTLTPDQLRRGFAIGDRLVEPARNRICSAEGETPVEPKVMAVLLCLAERAGEVVSRQTLYDAVWGKTIVSDQALTNCISELRQALGDDRAKPGYIETVPKRGYRLVALVRAANGTEPIDRRPLPLVLVAIAAVAAVAMLGLLGWWWLAGSGKVTGKGSTSIVVIPFENPGNETDLDYLRLALPDEITTLLTASRGLVVRPFEHAVADAPLAVGRARDAGHVVTGHYYLEAGERLTVAVEAQEVAGERILWRARITVPADDLLAMRAELAKRVHGGLLPALGAAVNDVAPQPANREAYDLYLRSLALPRHPELTERAIGLLLRAVEQDPQFAPAWSALGMRWYEHVNYGEGGKAAWENSLAAYRKALALDPAAISAAVGIANHRAESGELEEAFHEAYRLVERFEEHAESHLSLALVYRFGGMLDASQQHCERAYALDAGNPRLRSCGYSFLYAGKLDRVQAFLDIDEGSYFSLWGTVLLNLRRGNDAVALTAARQVAPDRHIRQFMEPCLEGRRGAELDDVGSDFVGFWSVQRDPELAYGLTPLLEYCGRREEALGFLERAVTSNFCAFPALDQDPIWADARGDARFAPLREHALACHRRFREVVERTASTR